MSQRKTGVQVCVDRSYNTCMCEDDSIDMGVDEDTEIRDSTGDSSTSDMAEESTHLMTKLVGLWSGGASQTPLGTFPLMNMDLRPVDDIFLFSRVDLDTENALRFAFYYETINGATEFVFRNGGLFAGLERDTKTILIEATDETFTFCEPDRGCDYLTATFAFEDANHVVLDVRVGQMPHLRWDAFRVEDRSSPTPFPADFESLGTDVPFPEMADLSINITVSEQSVGETAVWVVLSNTGCGLTGRDCEASRSIRVAIPDGATTGSSNIVQLHEANYFVNAIWDRNGNFETRPFPDSGDEIATPDGMVRVQVGSSTDITTSFAVP